MKRPALSLLACSLILAGTMIGGCGGDDRPAKDPYEVLNGAFETPAPVGDEQPGGEVVVASLGYQDSILRRRVLTVDPPTYASITEAIASPQRGLEDVVADIEYEGTEEIDGVETDHVSGRLDIEKLISSLEKAISAGAAGEDEGEALPGLGNLSRLEETLVDGRFDLYADRDGGAFERLDMTLSLDDRDNALPPSRIRFSLTESDPSEAPG